MSAGHLQALWCDVLLEALASAGVRDVVLSPGSRSTPLVLAATRLQQHSRLRIHDVIDERAAAFFALGQARVSGQPSLLLCTSGTAAAHYLPAVIEATLAGVPLLALTADRPFELQACAAPQTIDQVKLYGDHVRASFELGLPDASLGALRALRRMAAQAVHRSLWPQPGAVHLNARARKPLEPAPADSPEDHRLEAQARALMQTPLTRALTPRRAPHAQDSDALRMAIADCAGEGLIVCGPAPLAQEALREELFQLAAASGMALCSEAPSQLRLCPVAAGVHVVDAFDALLRQPRLREALTPWLILQIGSPPTSTGYEQFISERPDLPRVVIAPQAWDDPHSSAEALLMADLGEVLASLRPRCWEPAPGPLQRLLRQGEALAWEALDEVLASEELSEGAAVREVVAAQPAGATLVLGNSLPIREVDLWCQRPSHAGLRIIAQRGANGIDGLVAGAAGAASRSQGPVTLLLGDISLQHDLTSLGLCRGVTIVVINNGGGRIFEQLPLGRAADAGTLAHFTTPHGLRFAAAAQLYGLRYACATDRAELRAALAAVDPSQATLLEVIVPADSAARQQRQVAALLDARLTPLLPLLEAQP